MSTKQTILSEISSQIQVSITSIAQLSDYLKEAHGVSPDDIGTLNGLMEIARVLGVPKYANHVYKENLRKRTLSLEQIMELYNAKVPMAKIAIMANVSRQHIHMLIKVHLWKEKALSPDLSHSA